MPIYYLTKQGLPVDPNGKPVSINIEQADIDDALLVMKEAAEGEPGITNDGEDGAQAISNFTLVKGIGEVRQGELEQLGIFTFEQLATADLDELATAMEVAPEKIAEWQNEAARLAQS